MPGEVIHYEIIPDEKEKITEALKKSADQLKADLILTTGGTGLSPRDVTPDATREVIEKEVPGFSEAMRAESLKKTPHAMISRADLRNPWLNFDCEFARKPQKRKRKPGGDPCSSPCPLQTKGRPI